VTIVTKSPAAEVDPKELDPLLNRAYYIDRKSATLARSYGDFEKMSIGQI
jgi:hypothetical protein